MNQLFWAQQCQYGSLPLLGITYYHSCYFHQNTTFYHLIFEQFSSSHSFISNHIHSLSQASNEFIFTEYFQNGFTESRLQLKWSISDVFWFQQVIQAMKDDLDIIQWANILIVQFSAKLCLNTNFPVSFINFYQIRGIAIMRTNGHLTTLQICNLEQYYS